MGWFDSFKKLPAPKTPAQTTAPPAPKLPAAENPKHPSANPPAQPAVRSAVTSPAPSPPAAGMAAEQRRVLFVGVDPLWFQQVDRDIHFLQPGWSCLRAADRIATESLLASASFDSLVVNGRMPWAADWLAGPDNNIGNVVRLVRCNLSDRPAVARWNHSGTTAVSEDGDAAGLVASLKMAERLRDWMADPAIKKLLPLIHKLPAAPKLHTQVTEELQSPTGSLQVVARLIAQDPVMSAKILQVVNSTFFGLTQEVADTAEAVMVLGTERIKSLILLAGVFSQYASDKCPGFSPEPVWGHSLQVGSFARSIVLAETGSGRMAEAAFTAGLLHDIGKLILAGNVPDMFEAVRRLQVSKKISELEAELMVLDTTHAELGACLLATWGLPLPILEAIAWHHKPERSAERGFSLLTVVHVADVIAQECSSGSGGDNEIDRVNVEFLLQSGLGDCRNRWREFCGVVVKSKMETKEEHHRQRRASREN